MTPTPTPARIREAILDWAPGKVRWCKGWSTRGRPWQYGLRGVVEHHAAGVGDGVLAYMLNRNGRYPFCNEYTRRDGTIDILTGLSAWHSGAGGPWPRAGVPRDLGHLMLWGREFETRGQEKDLTDEQLDSAAAIDCAMREVGGWAAFDRLINHRDWTDGGQPLGLSYWLPTRGRKIDTLYAASVFRANARRRLGEPGTGGPGDPPRPKATVDLSDLLASIANRRSNPSIALVATALTRVVTGPPGVSTRWDPAIRAAYASWQKRLGYRGSDADGIPGLTSMTALGDKADMFRVVV